MSMKTDCETAACIFSGKNMNINVTSKIVAGHLREIAIVTKIQQLGWPSLMSMSVGVVQ